MASVPDKDSVLPATAPEYKPEFTIGDLRKVIPKEYFIRSNIKSFGWLLHDISLITITTYLATYIDIYITNPFINLIFWLITWYILGCFYFGIWILGHECGHEAFSDNIYINNIIGWILHSSLLTPFFSWQYSHKLHHSKTNNLNDDTAFVPRPSNHLNQEQADKAIINLSPIERLQYIVFMTLFGWPLYLWFDWGGSPKNKSWISHFNPFCELFPLKFRKYVILSDIGCLLTLYLLYTFVYKQFGLIALIKYYFIPYLWNNFWLVVITYLHHKDYNLPKYNTKEWTWIRGAFGAIDRNYGWFHNYTHHHIADTHVVHHLFSKLPHYNAVKVTNILNNNSIYFNKYRQVSKQTWYQALWELMGETEWFTPKLNKELLLLKYCKYPIIKKIE